MKSTCRLPLMLIVLAAALFAAGCGHPAYDDYRRLLTDELGLMKEFITAGEKAADAGEMARAVEGLAAGLVRLGEELRAVEAAHPELPDLAAHPSELSAELAGLEKAVDALDELLLKKAKLFSDPKVAKALEEVLALRGGLGL